MKIHLGRRYRLRNGVIVTALKREVYRWHDAKGKPQSLPWFVLESADGGRTTCQEGGTYAHPGVGVHPHELDIVGRA